MASCHHLWPAVTTYMMASCDLTDLVVGGVLGWPAGGGGGAAPVALPGVGEVWVGGAILRHPALSLLFYFGLRDKVLESNLRRYILFIHIDVTTVPVMLWCGRCV